MYSISHFLLQQLAIHRQINDKFLPEETVLRKIKNTCDACVNQNTIGNTL